MEPARPPTHGGRPTGTTRSYEPTRTTAGRPAPSRPAYRTDDRRYNRPAPTYLRQHPQALRPPPRPSYYRPYYSRWWVHPYYRHTYATTVVVGLPFVCSPWSTVWVPPVRVGWSWSTGYWAGSVWYPGYWAPLNPAPVGYVYVHGWWDGQVYVDGFYRPNRRTDGDWRWVEGRYLANGVYLRGHWEPAKAGPAGYVWEGGFWDGERWVDGFWRPEYRSAYTWVSAWYDEDGIFHTGYWAPLEQAPGYTWVPGWFDGNQWVPGYWVDANEYQNTDVQSWTPEPGYNDGWEDAPQGGTRSMTQGGDVPDDLPLGLPVEM